MRLVMSGNVYPKTLTNFDNREVKKLTQKLQNISACGTAEIVKTFLKFADP